MNHLLIQKNTSENLTKTITETYINNIKALENLKNKLLEKINDRGMYISKLFDISFI